MKGAAGSGFAGASARRLSASVAALADDKADIAPLWGKLYSFGDAISPCL